MTSHEFDRLKHYGIGIPDDPSEEEAKHVMMLLQIGTRYHWPKGEWVDCLRWVDGHPIRFHVQPA